MTSLPPVLSPRPTPVNIDRFDVRWTGFAANGERMNRWQQIELLVSVTELNDEGARFDAWLQQAQDGCPARRLLVEPVACRVVYAGRYLHVDATSDDCLLAITLRANHGGHGWTLRYARTTLLETAGFSPGSCDPPAVDIATR